MLQNPSKSLERKMSSVRLSPEEVFLEVMTLVDYAFEDHNKAEMDFMGLHDQLFCDIRDLCPNDTDEKEVALAASEIIFVVSVLLTMTDIHSYRKMGMTLVGQISNDNYTALTELFNPYIERIGENKINTYLKEYLRSDDFISDEIHDRIQSVPKLVKLPSATAAASEQKSEIRIAKGKKTSVLIVLNAMYKAGWFVDENEKELTNRDVTLNNILKYAFGINKPTAISQTINPSENTDTRKQEKLIDKLINEKDAETFIKELKAELLKNVK